MVHRIMGQPNWPVNHSVHQFFFITTTNFLFPSQKTKINHTAKMIELLEEVSRIYIIDTLKALFNRSTCSLTWQHKQPSVIYDCSVNWRLMTKPALLQYSATLMQGCFTPTATLQFNDGGGWWCSGSRISQFDPCNTPCFCTNSSLSPLLASYFHRKKQSKSHSEDVVTTALNIQNLRKRNYQQP